MKNTTLATLSVLVTSCAWASSLWLSTEGRRAEGVPTDSTRTLQNSGTLQNSRTLQAADLADQPQGGSRPLASNGTLATRSNDTTDDRAVRMTPVVRAVQRSADSVVSIYVAVKTRGGSAPAGQGSGVILDPSGLVITNWHVVAQAASNPQNFELSARLRDDRQYSAKLISTSPDDDLALLKVDPAGDTLTAADLGESSSLMLGETVVAIGNPQGSANTVTVGVLSNRDKSITVRAPDGRVRRYTGLLQTDAAINQGNSGGALLDITGKLIGVNNAMAQGAENIGFAIPVDTVRRVFRDVLLSSENFAGVWLGLQVRNLNNEVIVSEVTPGGPAARAGLRRGDRLMQLGDTVVANALDYARKLVDVQPGAAVEFRYERNGRKQRTSMRPLTPTGRVLANRLGIEIDEITPDQDRELVAQTTQAASNGRARFLLRAVLRVRSVYPGGPANAIGIEVGDVLTKAEQMVGWRRRRLDFVTNTRYLADLTRSYSGESMPIEIFRPGEGVFTGIIDVPR